LQGLWFELDEKKKFVGFSKRGEDVLRFVDREGENYVDVFVLIEIYFFSCGCDI